MQYYHVLDKFWTKTWEYNKYNGFSWGGPRSVEYTILYNKQSVPILLIYIPCTQETKTFTNNSIGSLKRLKDISLGKQFMFHKCTKYKSQYLAPYSIQHRNQNNSRPSHQPLWSRIRQMNVETYCVQLNNFWGVFTLGPVF